MPTKTITLEVDAYHRLKASNKPGESFSSVVRQATFPEAHPTGKTLLEWAARPGHRITDRYLNEVEAAADADEAPRNPWIASPRRPVERK